MIASCKMFLFAFCVVYVIVHNTLAIDWHVIDLYLTVTLAIDWHVIDLYLTVTLAIDWHVIDLYPTCFLDALILWFTLLIIIVIQNFLLHIPFSMLKFHL